MSDEINDDPSGDELRVRRPARQDKSTTSTRRRLILGGIAALVLIGSTSGFLLLRPDEKKVVDPPPRTTVTVNPTTTPTVPEVLATTVMPLTGVPVDGNDPAVATRLMSPVLAVKIDNAPNARPQFGIEAADVVIELRVEGISRYMAAFHSSLPERVGPVRSARTSDPDLLAMFVKPVFAWSGGNAKVAKLVGSSEWIKDASHDRRSDAYSRDRSRRAPHNLILSPEALGDLSGALSPAPLFSFRQAGQEPGGVPVAGFDIDVGESPAGFRWDEGSGRWLRLAYGTEHEAANGERISATNVLVLQTTYVRSQADRRSPEAETIGEGAAWVFTAGRMIEGRWNRPSREAPWALTTSDGAPIALTPGNTWIELPDTDQTPRVVDPSSH